MTRAVAGSLPRARPSARPRPGRRVPGTLSLDRLTARVRPDQAPAVVEGARTGRLADVAAEPHALLVTRRRDGRWVATPVWAAVADGRAYVRTERAAGKVKRLRRRPEALLAPCTRVGRPLGPALAVSGRVLAPHEEPAAERTLAERYGWRRRCFERGVDLLRVDMCYLELVPESTGQAAAAS